jgi:ribosomal protein S6E (S10)
MFGVVVQLKAWVEKPAEAREKNVDRLMQDAIGDAVDGCGLGRGRSAHCLSISGMVMSG